MTDLYGIAAPCSSLADKFSSQLANNIIGTQLPPLQSGDARCTFPGLSWPQKVYRGSPQNPGWPIGQYSITGDVLLGHVRQVHSPQLETWLSHMAFSTGDIW